MIFIVDGAEKTKKSKHPQTFLLTYTCITSNFTG
jgi:hypothetical protein